MAQPPSLRLEEQVIEEFGVSRKYTFLLIILGLLAGIGALIASLVDDPLVEAFSTTAGPLGPLMFMAVEGMLLVAGLFLIIQGVYFTLAYHYFLTNERVIEAVGFLAQRTVSVDYSSITDLIVRQDIINRLVLNTGMLMANTPGGPREEIILLNIDNPQARREQLRSLAQAIEAGQPVDKRYLAELKVKTGMASDVATAYEQLAGKAAQTIPGERREPVMPPQVPSPVSPKPSIAGVSPNEGVEDFNGDGRIDESERLRSAQKKMQMPNDE